MPAVSVHKPHGTRLNVGTPLSPSPSPASGRGEQGRTTCRWLLPSYANPVCALAGKAKLPARRGLWHENGLQDPSGGQFGFFVTPLSASNANTPPSLRRKPQSSGAFDGDGALFWTPVFAGVTADGACGMKMAYKTRLAGSLVFLSFLPRAPQAALVWNTGVEAQISSTRWQATSLPCTGRSSGTCCLHCSLA